jgi:NRAMP (natural resistance-associated macrophage protein)-like metal ion transporter
METKPKGFWRTLLKKIGPGFITGAADDDPSGIATYTQTGAQFGYNQLWTALFSFPFMVAIQEMCGRIGLVTGKGLAATIRQHYAKWVLYVSVGLLIVANTINIGANLGAMAATVNLLLPIRFEVLLIGITIITLLLEVFVSYPRYANFLKWLTLTLFSYVIVAFLLPIDWSAVAYATFVPTITWSPEYLLNIVAILGTTISPYLFFWEADQEVEEEIAKGKLRRFGFGRPRVTSADVRGMRVDTVLGMFFSNAVMFFIIVVASATLASQGITSIDTASDAVRALEPVAGPFAALLFAIGIIGVGLLAVPILAGSAAYAVAEIFRWREGLSLKFKQAHGFYGVITVATLVGLIVNFLGIPPFTMLYYTAICNGIAAPPLIILIVLIANNKKIMGNRTNAWLSNLLGITLAIVMSTCALALLWSFI